MFKILYVYGYGGSCNGSTSKYLRQCLPSDKFEIICENYSQYDPKLAIQEIKDIVESKKIDLVVGSSLGGYIALNLRGVPKLVLNPCVHPEIELEKLISREKDGTIKKAVPDFVVKNYKTYIKTHNVWENFDSEEKLTTTALFGTNDELLGMKYKGEVSKYTKWVYTVEQGHSSTLESVKNNLAPHIIKWFDEHLPSIQNYFGAGVHV